MVGQSTDSDQQQISSFGTGVIIINTQEKTKNKQNKTQQADRMVIAKETGHSIPSFSVKKM